MRYREYAIAPLILLVASCGFMQDTGNPAVDDYANAVRRIGLACDSYSASLSTLTVLRDAGRLSDETRADVTRIRNTVGVDVCDKADPPLVMADGRDTIAFIEPLIYELLQIRQGATP